jgi:hypothetical protein
MKRGLAQLGAAALLAATFALPAEAQNPPRHAGHYGPHRSAVDGRRAPRPNSGSVSHNDRVRSGYRHRTYVYYYDPYYPYSPYRCYPGYNCGTVYYGSCAPQDVEGNLSTADRVLTELASNELKTSETFKLKVADIVALPAGKEKADAYLRMAGVKDVNDNEEVLGLIYAREVAPRNLQAVQENLQLTPEQSKLLLERLTSALQAR